MLKFLKYIAGYLINKCRLAVEFEEDLLLDEFVKEVNCGEISTPNLEIVFLFI